MLIHLVNKFNQYNSNKKLMNKKKEKYLYLYCIVNLLNQFGTCIYCYQKNKIREDEFLVFNKDIINNISILKEIAKNRLNDDMPNETKLQLLKLIEKSENNWELTLIEKYKNKLLQKIYEEPNIDNNNNNIYNKNTSDTKYDKNTFTNTYKNLNKPNKSVSPFNNKIDEDKNNNNIILNKKTQKANINININKNNEKILSDYSKLIYKTPFENIIGDNFVRYFLKNVINGFECLDRNDLIHFDIKPENILICLNLVFKISDFGLLRNPKQIKRNNDENDLQIPGGTRGYLTPEYYDQKNITKDIAKKQDYFSLGATIFYLKYGYKMLDYQENLEETIRNADNVIDSLQIAMDEIKTTQGCDKGFIDFLCNLIQYKPDDRPIFEEIYRNKWLHKYSKEIGEIFENNESDEEKLMLELNKSDFLLYKKQDLDEIKNNNINNINNKNNYQRHKFKFQYNNNI